MWSFFQKKLNSYLDILFFFVSLHLQSRDSKNAFTNCELMSTRVSHSGIVDSISNGCVRVRIQQTSSCAACHVASHCNAADSKEKVVDVYDVSNINSLKPGDIVVVYTSGKMASRALLMGFGIPFLILVSVLTGVLWFTGNEGASAIAALFALGLYYLVLYFCRDCIKQNISFHIDYSNQLKQ